MSKLVGFFAFVLIFPLVCLAQETESASPELVVHLLDYLAKDYGGAVQDGEVISPFEYAEQVEFAQIVETNALGTSALHSDASFMEGITQLKGIIDNKGPADEVAQLARSLQQQAILLSQIRVAPRSWPDISHGAQLYRTNCALCHGEGGRGDGPGGVGLEPAPSDFLDPDLVRNSSPYKFYNTIRLGVPGTGMAPFAHFSDSDVWALAFYLKSLPYAEGEKSESAQVESLNLSLEQVATLTDSEISELLFDSRILNHPRHQDETVGVLLMPNVSGALAEMRSGARGASENPITIARSLLQESLAAAQAGNFGAAQKLGIRAYLEGIEPIEPKLQANAPGYVAQIESLMTNYRALLDRKESAAIQAKNSEILDKLDEIQELLSENRMSAAIAFGAAFSIFLREGFEALLIIVVLISILRAMDQPKAIFWVHIGWASALAVGVAAWFASGALLAMSGLSREVMEGGIALLAVAVLIYVGFWLHRHAEAKRWRRFLEAQLKKGLSKGSYLGIALVSFMAVFREAFEVVLFLRAIWMDLDPSGQSIAGLGVLASLGVLGVLSFLLIKKSRNIPVGLLFRVCSWTMITLAVILAGKGVHSLQEAGVVAVSPLDWGVQIDLLGIYPQVETLLLQGLTIVLFGLLVLMGFRKNSQESATAQYLSEET